MKRYLIGILIIQGTFCLGQNDSCYELDSLYSLGRFDEAFRHLETHTDWPCKGEDYRLLKAKVLLANYRFSEARYELANLNTAEAKNLRLKVNEMARISSRRTGASTMLSDKNAYSHNNLLLNINGISLIDTQFVLAEFPRTEYSEIAFFPKVDDGNQLSEWLHKQNLIEILPGSVWNDSIGAITALFKRPFQSEGLYYEVAVIDLFKQKLIATLNSGAKAHTMYPCLLKDRVIFASDRPGGFGGYDLWFAPWNGSSFGEIENLGSEINSPGNEIYPLYFQDYLIFASDREDLSFGGFDLFRKSDSGSIENLGLPINSSADDLNPVFHGKEICSVSSNRDTAFFRLYDIKHTDTTEVFAEIYGRIEIEGLNLGGKYLLIANADSTQQRQVMLDKDGYFRVFQLKGLESYSLTLPELDLSDAEGRMVLYNEKGDRIVDVRMNRYGAFVFELLKPEDYYLSKEENKDESLLALDISGLFENSAKSEFVLALENSEGELIGLTKTDLDGRFVFESVAPDDEYTIRTEVKNPNGLIRILNEKGEVIQTIHPEDQNGYVHLRLGESDRVITITDEENRKVKISELETFDLPTIYFDSDESDLTAESKKRLAGFLNLVQKNPGVFIEISGHTDSRGEQDYNLKLSQKRIDSVVELLKSSGVDHKRIKGRGYGESMLKNHCKDNIPCSEEEHAENRRTELRLYQNQLLEP